VKHSESFLRHSQLNETLSWNAGGYPFTDESYNRKYFCSVELQGEVTPSARLWRGDTIGGLDSPLDGSGTRDHRSPEALISRRRRRFEVQAQELSASFSLLSTPLRDWFEESLLGRRCVFPVTFFPTFALRLNFSTCDCASVYCRDILRGFGSLPSSLSEVLCSHP